MRLWLELSSVPDEFVLYGETALALHLGHQNSVDFDFFGDRPLRQAELETELPFMAGAKIIQRERNTLSAIVDRGGPVKVSFFGGLSLGRVGEVSASEDTGVRVASLLDLAAQKVRVVQVRAERKDYADLLTLMQHGIPLTRALGAARALYPDFAPVISLKALSYFADGDLGSLPADAKAALSRAAEGVRATDDVPLLNERLT